MKSLNQVAMLLVVVGAVNWGLVGLADVNLVSMVLGSGTILTKVVYILVGVSGLLVGMDLMNRMNGKKK